jgi:Phage terminase large subunit (GpA)
VCPTYRKATLLATVRRLALGALIPPLRLHLSKWIERELVLPEGVSALPGAVRLWPYQREIANAIKDPACERVTLLKPTRVGEASRLRLAARAAWPWPPPGWPPPGQRRPPALPGAGSTPAGIAAAQRGRWRLTRWTTN